MIEEILDIFQLISRQVFRDIHKHQEKLHSLQKVDENNFMHLNYPLMIREALINS